MKPKTAGVTLVFLFVVRAFQSFSPPPHLLSRLKTASVQQFICYGFKYNVPVHQCVSLCPSFSCSKGKLLVVPKLPILHAIAFLRNDDVMPFCVHMRSRACTSSYQGNNLYVSKCSGYYGQSPVILFTDSCKVCAWVVASTEHLNTRINNQNIVCI